MDRCRGRVLVAHQIGRGGDLGTVLGLHVNFEIRRLVGVDLGDFRLGLGQRLAGGVDGGAQRIENAGIAGQGFELLDPGAGLVRHEVIKIEADFFGRFGDLGIGGGIGLGFAFDGGRQFHARSGIVDGKGVLPLGGKVGGKVGGRAGMKIVGVRGRVHRHFLDGEFGMAAAAISGPKAGGAPSARARAERSGSSSGAPQAARRPMKRWRAQR